MKLFIFSLLFLPLTMFSEINDSTKIEIVSHKIVSSLPKNKAQIKIIFFNPEGNPTIPKDVVLIIGEDTICYNSKPPKTDSLFLTNGEYTIQIHSKWWGSVSKQIKLESQQQVTIKVLFGAIPQKLPLIIYHYDKPVIYVYPKKEQETIINIEVKGNLSFTYPRYNKEWRFIASPDGSLNFGDKNYNYLFWEGEGAPNSLNLDPFNGFVIFSDSLVPFFETTLTKIGLTPKEQQDFITFWVPLMKKNNQNLIQFIYNKEYDAIAELKIEPKPDNIIRLFMFWKNFEQNDNITITKPIIPIFSRDGFSVIEWGGCEIKN